MSLFRATAPTQPPTGAGSPAGPGEQLTQARKRWGMSREQVASTLRLPNKVIAALEEEHYEGLPPAAFVRGYLSGYARLVGLDASELVAACEMRGCGDPALASKRSLSLTKGRGETLFRWASYGLLLAFIASAVIYWTEHEPAPPPVAAAIPPAPPVHSHSTVAAAPRETPPLVALRDPAANNNVAGAAATDPLSPAANPGKQPAMADTTLAAKAAAVADNTASSDESNWPVLDLQFSADSWLAVRDAGGNRLAWETVKAGSTRQLRGAPPLKVVLGNATAVAIVFAGQKFDPQPYTTGRIARFSVQ